MTKPRALDAFFESYYRLRPVNATFTGVHDHDHLLPDWSRDGMTAAIAEMGVLRSAIGHAATTARFSSPPHPALGVSDSIKEIDHALADAFLDIQIAEMEGSHFQRRNPSLHLGEVVFSIVALMLGDESHGTERATLRAEALAARLRALPQFLQTAIDLIGTTVIPIRWVARADTECGGAHQLFGNGLVQWCAHRELPGSLRRAIGDAATGALRATREYQQWLSGRDTDDKTADGCGSDLLDLLLRRGHQLRVPRGEILAHAREQLIEANTRWEEMSLAADRAGWPGVHAQLDRDRPILPRYLPTFQEAWDQCRALAARHDLVTWSDLPVRYGAIPQWACDAAPRLYFLNYRSPPPFDLPSVAPYFVPDMFSAGMAGRSVTTNGVSTSVIKSNHVAHHGALGHHVQNAHAYRSASRIGQVAAVDCASRIGMFCGGTMAEGWACYATDVMEEVGYYTTLESVALQQSRVRQLARAIVDIELHQGTMNAAEAQRFFVDEARMDAVGADKDVTRISMFPGTGLMYWVGTEMIHRLRAQRESLEGSQFSLRAFHDELLSFGSIPVALIAQEMTTMGVP